MSETAKPAVCGVCGEPMPEGEQMFKCHGYSGPCPAPPLPAPDRSPEGGPSGWKLVPVKPTEEMIDAGCESDAYSIAVHENKASHDALMAKYPGLKPKEKFGAAPVQTLPIVWKAMLDAAPAAPASGAGQLSEELLAAYEAAKALDVWLVAKAAEDARQDARTDYRFYMDSLAAKLDIAIQRVEDARRDKPAPAALRPSPAPPGWEAAREALLRASGALLALRSFQDSTWPAETAAKIYEDAELAQKQIAAALAGKE